MSAMLKRVAVTRATMEHFAPKRCSWKTGATCVHLARKQLVGMGHRPPPVSRFRSPLSALRAMKERGWSGLSEMMDSLLPPIAPARAIVGDIVEFPSEDELNTLAVVVGNGRVMGYFGDTDLLTIAQPIGVPLAAWRT